MLKFVVLAFIAVTAASKSVQDLEAYNFEKFVADFGMKYAAQEFETRKSIFNAELARVKAHNARSVGWTEGINKFSAMSASEKKSFTGRSKNHASAQKNGLKFLQPLPKDLVMKSVSQLPDRVDWRDLSVVTPVKDQGYCGSCWAFASTAVIESHVALASGLVYDLSPEQMAMCAPNPNSCGGTGGCAGSTAELAFEYVSGSKGLAQEFQYPYTSYYGKDAACSAAYSSSPVATINGYVQLPENNYTALINAVAQVGPIAVSVDASSWSAYKGGIFNGCNQAKPDIDHAVVLVGYGEENGQKYWLIRNSWSPSWGEKGYIRLARFDADTDEANCGMDTTPQDGTACAGDDTPVKVCGTCGVLYDSAYPLNAKSLK
eukprot:gene26160-34773_t